MEDQNYIANYFIDKIEVTQEKLTIILSKDFPAYLLNEIHNRPITMIEIINPELGGSIEELKGQMDFYNDGIIFSISMENNGKMVFQTTDLGGRIFTLRGTEIIRKDLPYSNDQLLAAIDHYRQCLESSNKTIVDLQDKIEAIKRYAEKVINNANEVLSTLDETGGRRQKWTIKRETWQTVINLLN